jgi:molybdate transport system ATP-binding protein
VITDGGTRIETAEHADGLVHVSFPTHAVALHRERPAGSPRNVWPTIVTGLRTDGDRVVVSLDGEFGVTAIVTAAAVDALGLTAGARCWASVKATELAITPA